MSDKLVAYVGKRIEGSGFGCDCTYGARNELTDWHGNRIGTCVMATSWRVNSYVGSRMYQIYAWSNGKEYTGRGFGESMAVVLRETARSRKAVKGISANGRAIPA